MIIFLKYHIGVIDIEVDLPLLIIIIKITQ